MVTRLGTCAVLVSVFASAAIAQSFSRDAVAWATTVKELGATGQVSSRGAVRLLNNFTTGNSTLFWNHEDPSGPNTITSATVPFQRAGGLVRLSHSHWLLSGVKYTDPATHTGPTGVLCRISFDWSTPATPVINVLETVDYSSFDPVQIAFNRSEGRLYVRDYLGRRVLFAPWSIGQALPVDATFQVCATRTLVPELDHTQISPRMRRADLGNWGSTIDVANSAHSQGQVEDPPGTDGFKLFLNDHEYIRVHQQESGSWTASTGEWTYFHPGSKHWWVDTDGFFAGGERTFNVHSSGLTYPVTAEIKNVEDGTVLWTGPLTAPTTALGPFAAFQADPGKVYQISSAGSDLPPTLFRSCVRYGLPSSGGFDFTIGKVTADSYGPYNGQTDFGVGLVLRPGTTSTVPSQVLVALHIAFRPPSGVDPVTIIGDVAILNPVIAIPVSFGAGELPPDVSRRLEFGNVDSLTPLFQFLFADGVNVGWSDVFGLKGRTTLPFSEIYAPPAAPASAPASATSSASEAASSWDDRVRAACAELEEGCGEFTEQEKRWLRDLRRRALRQRR